MMQESNIDNPAKRKRMNVMIESYPILTNRTKCKKYLPDLTLSYCHDDGERDGTKGSYGVKDEELTTSSTR